MKDWKITSHTRTVSRWDRDLGRRVSQKVDTVEARKHVGDMTNILLVARSDAKTIMSMNGPLELAPFFLNEMAEIVSYIEDCRDKGITF